MDVASLRQSIGIHTQALGKNLEGITHEKSLIQPPDGANCINWVAGHILFFRNDLHALLGAEPAWSDERMKRYDRGSAPITDPADALPFDELRAGLEKSIAAMAAAAEAMDPARLAEPAAKGTVGDRLSFLLFHETYHIGQFGVLRRTAGLPGALG